MFPHIDIGIVFSGTLGLEMLLAEIPVIACGKVPHGGLSLIAEPQTVFDYREMLINGVGIVRPDKKRAELFAYFYFIKVCIPWTITTQAFADNFKGFTTHSLNDLLPGNNKYLDHLCDCILKRETTVVEGWV